jgi:hypothetical protein
MRFNLPKQIAFIFLIVSQADAADLASDASSKLIGESVAWQQHLDNDMGLSSNWLSTVDVTICEQSEEILVKNFKWVVSFGCKGNQFYPINVEQLGQLPQEVSTQEIAPFMHLRTTTLEVPDYTKRFQKLSSLQPNVYEKLLACFIAQACSQESLSNYTDGAGQTIKNPEIWIAPVDRNFPVIMYFVEGVPYLGKVYFDTKTLKPIYFSFDYVSDDPEWRKACFKLMAKIRTEGDLFVFTNGRLICRKAQ